MLYKKNLNQSGSPTFNPSRFLMNMRSGPGSQPLRGTSGSNMFNPSNAGAIGRPTGSAPAFGGNHQAAARPGMVVRPHIGAK